MNLPPTDELLETKSKKERDFDTQMLFGCSGFVVVSFTTYFACVWPFLVWLSIDQYDLLLKCLAAAYLPAFLLGFIAAKKFELPGAAGFVGGILAAAIFLYLRFEQAFLEAQARRSPVPEYPHFFQYLVPVAIVLAAILLSGLTLMTTKEMKDLR